MIVAFMDLLGFSNLLRNNMEVAIDNLNTFNSVIKTRQSLVKFTLMEAF